MKLNALGKKSFDIGDKIILMASLPSLLHLMYNNVCQITKCTGHFWFANCLKEKLII